MEEALRTIGRILFAKDKNHQHTFIEFAYYLTQNGASSVYKDKVLSLYKRLNRLTTKEPNQQDVRVRLFAVPEHSLVVIVAKDFLGPIERKKLEEELDVTLTDVKEGIYSFPLPTLA